MRVSLIREMPLSMPGGDEYFTMQYCATAALYLQLFRVNADDAANILTISISLINRRITVIHALLASSMIRLFRASHY